MSDVTGNADAKLTKVKDDPKGHWTLFKNKRGEPVILAKNVRCSFPHFDEPYIGDDKKGDPDAKGSYGMTAMVDKEKQKAIKDICVEVINKFLVDNEVKALSADKKFIRNGDEAGRPEYEGHFIISSRNPKRPKLRNKKNENVDKDDILDVFYSGCYVDVLFAPWFQDGKKVGKGFGMRVNSRLVAVKFAGDGEPLAGDSISDDDVDDVFGGSTGGGFDDEDDSDTDDL